MEYPLIRQDSKIDSSSRALEYTISNLIFNNVIRSTNNIFKTVDIVRNLLKSADTIMTKLSVGPRPHLNIKTVFPRYGYSNIKDKTVARPSYLW